MLTPEDMARIAKANAPDATTPIQAKTFADLLAAKTTLAITRPHGFLIFIVAGEVADIHSIDVAPEAQGQGIATEMLQYGLAELKDRGVREVFLEVDTGNLPALKLYDHAGFFVVGTRPDYYKHADGSRSDAYIMAHYFGKEAAIGAVDRKRLSL